MKNSNGTGKSHIKDKECIKGYKLKFQKHINPLNSTQKREKIKRQKNLLMRR